MLLYGSFPEFVYRSIKKNLIPPKVLKKLVPSQKCHEIASKHFTKINNQNFSNKIFTTIQLIQGIIFVCNARITASSARRMHEETFLITKAIIRAQYGALTMMELMLKTNECQQANFAVGRVCPCVVCKDWHYSRRVKTDSLKVNT